MTFSRTKLWIASALAACILFSGIAVHEARKRAKPVASGASANTGPVDDVAGIKSKGETGPIVLYAHNLRLRQGPSFRVYVRWIRGQMIRTRQDVNPSFDDPETFVLRIDKGVIHANIGDVSAFLNANAPKDAPLTKISIVPDGEKIKLRGTVHKIIPMPIELDGMLAATSEHLVSFHVTKINVLKIPLKGLLGGFHIELADLVHKTNVPGVRVVDNDIIFDTEKLLPPPHIRGPITSINISGPDLEVIYGAAKNDETKLSKWHNFLKLTGGTLDFGKLTMRDVDLTMIDATQDAWFDLDLVNYQQQLVNGYTRITPEAGLEIYMPNFDDKKPIGQAISMDWLKNRNAALPPDVPRP